MLLHYSFFINSVMKPIKTLSLKFTLKISIFKAYAQAQTYPKAYESY